MFQIKPEYVKDGELVEAVSVGNTKREFVVAGTRVLDSSVVRLEGRDGSLFDVLRERPVTVIRREY